MAETTPVTSQDFQDRESAQDAMARLASGEATLPAGTVYTPETQEVQQDEMVTYGGLGPAPTVSTAQASTPTGVTAPTKPEAPKVEDVPTAADKITEAQAATTAAPSEGAVISEDEVAQGQVSEGAVAQAAQGEVSEKATVKYQLGEIMSSIKAGEELPAWAAGAARGATAVMQQRGLGASSMASAAMVQALMEAGIPIAQMDAQTYSAMDMANLTARQQTTLANAAMFAAMDRANLDARMTAQVNNARAFLAIDAQNLTNEQQSATLSYQTAMEAVFKDQSLEYAAKQFNAQTQAQVDQFFAEMDVQVQNANANRVAAMDQFNAGESNAMTQFTTSMADARERFNTEMSVQIDQANALWRREINTQNTALINEANRLNTQNVLGITQNAQNALWQKYADEAAFIFEMAENESMRQHQVAMLGLESTYNTDMYERQFELEGLLEIGKSAIKAW
jgi:hypothetical protein